MLRLILKHKSSDNQMKCNRCVPGIAVEGFKKCESCLKRDREAQKIKREKRISNGLCRHCGKHPPTSKTYCHICNAKMKTWRSQYKIDVIMGYGGKCICCGETEFDFLTIDHINGGGNEHRKLLKSKGYTNTIQFYRLLKVSNFPKQFQCLCYNCNCAKGACGVCPHQRKREAEQFVQPPVIQLLDS